GGASPEVLLGAAGQRSVIATYQNDLSLKLQSVAPDSGKVRTELRLQTESCCNYAAGVWTAAGETIFIAQGADLILYDMATGRSRAYVKDLIAPAEDGRQRAISRLVVDPQYKRLIAVAADGTHSRIVPLDSLAAVGDDWRAADATLAQE
ncbi:MAG TPA: hypothetical protein VHA35_02940, partial [Dongiaceae bacterium]|nr:hypothetical protein [Dongiaceae bacterium]